jgi:SAM-dependent methyltransferase
MIEHFEETLGRAEFGQRLSGKLVLSSYPLGEEERVELAARASKGVFVSDHAGLSRKAFLPGLLSDRLSNSVHVEMLGSLLPMHAPRVLEIRSRLGSISAGLQRLYGATPQAMALFPNQQFLIQEVYGIPATSGIDYDNFTVPFDGTFDLIIANHMLTHALHPREMLATLHGRLTPGGHLYLFNEPDDREFLTSGKSLFNTMNPFHMQAFDGPSLVRTLEANGFAPTFVTTHNGSHVCLAQKREYTDTWTRMPDGLSSRRRRAYRNAQDRAALMMPVFARPRLGEPWDAVAARAVESGVAEVTAKGVVKLRRSEPA